MAKTILVFGLPGAGKTTLAQRLVEILGNADWYNADVVRKEADDWDFSDEGRARQMKRMKDLCATSNLNGRYAVADFVCPTEALRDEFDADYMVFMNTIDKGRFEDTNKIFEYERAADCAIDEDYWWEESWIEWWARSITCEVKQDEFDWSKPTVQMLGRFQPFHEGHRALFERALAKTGQVAIFVRVMPKTEDNPYTTAQVCDNIALELAEYAGKVEVISVPNIVNITYGRGVGYTIEQESFATEVEKISATKIRQSKREKGEL